MDVTMCVEDNKSCNRSTVSTRSCLREYINAFCRTFLRCHENTHGGLQERWNDGARAPDETQEEDGQRHGAELRLQAGGRGPVCILTQSLTQEKRPVGGVWRRALRSLQLVEHAAQMTVTNGGKEGGPQMGHGRVKSRVH